MLSLTTTASGNSDSKLTKYVEGLEELEQFNIDYSFIHIWQDFYDDKGFAFITFIGGTVLVTKQSYEFKTTILEMLSALAEKDSRYKVNKFLVADEDIVISKMLAADSAFEERKSSGHFENNSALDEFENVLRKALLLKASDIHFTALKSEQRAFAVFSVISKCIDF